MNVLVVGIDSWLGAAIAECHRKSGDLVHTTSRNKNKQADFYVELSHPGQWARPEIKYDRVYYCIGTGNVRVSRMETMQVNVFATLDYLKFIAPASMNPRGQVVVLSSTSGSITLSENVLGPVYAMSKAALNMGVKLLSLTIPQVRWTLMCPGRVNTQYRRYEGNQGETPERAAPMIVAAAEANKEKALTFINCHGQTLPF